MSEEVRVTMDDVRAAGLCSRGARAWFARHGLDWSEFLRCGLPAEVIEATGDAQALLAVEVAHGRRRRRR